MRRSRRKSRAEQSGSVRNRAARLFFFQAEDGIRDIGVTGVQTCALPILGDLLGRLGEVLRAASPLPEPTLAILSTGPEDQYYLDHNLFAEETGAILAERDEVEVDGGGYLVHKETGRRIDVIYERIEDGRIYDDHPRLVESHFEGRVQAIFAPNSEVIDDKGVYAFIPEMIRTYLGEEPMIPNLEIGRAHV